MSHKDHATQDELQAKQAVYMHSCTRTSSCTHALSCILFAKCPLHHARSFVHKISAGPLPGAAAGKLWRVDLEGFQRGLSEA
eukprot:1161220-Pelagomonas_calceolata.AAC.16